MALAEDEARDLVKSLWTDWMAERPDFDLYDDYYNGDHPLPQEPRRLTAAYAEMLKMSVSNWTKLVVDVVSERLEVQSVISAKNPARDPDAWKWWQDNNLDLHSNNVVVGALKHGISYCAVGKPLEGQESPRIIGQPATQVHVRYDPDTGKALAAIKVWQGRDGKTYVTLYDDEAAYRFRSPGKTMTSETWNPVVEPVDTQALEPNTDAEDGQWMIANELQQVPFVAFRCQPDLLGGFMSELAPVLSIQDRINKTTFHRLLAQEFTAFPQRWVTGIDIPTDPVTGAPIEPFQAAVDRLWVATDEATRFGQFPAGSSADYIASITSDVQALATQSRTPPHYLTGGMGQFPSGESVRATEYGLHQKVRDRKVSFGEAWGDTLRLAAKAVGSPLAEDNTMTVRWEDVEARTEGEIVDALLKMSTLGVPLKALWARWGATPDEITEWEKLAAEKEAADAAAQAELAAAAPAPGAPKPAPPGNRPGTPATPKDARNSAF